MKADPLLMAPRHGGGIAAAAHRWGIPATEWLDLSTGLNPSGWPVPPVPPALWQSLPDQEEALLKAAADYYGSDALLAVAGSQAAIEALPRLRSPGRVTVLTPSYGEHAWCWHKAGHRIHGVTFDRVRANPDAVPTNSDVVIVVRPNNPTGESLPRELLLGWLERLNARGGWLVVDEAFADSDLTDSLVAAEPPPGLVVLRSLGKFFGLAGARLGFVVAGQDIRDRLRQAIGPWSVSGPAAWVGCQALADRSWQQAQRRLLPRSAHRLRELLVRCGGTPQGETALFQWLPCEAAPALHEHLARHAILTRLFETPLALRIGLPGDDLAWRRLEQALRAFERRDREERVW